MKVVIMAGGKGTRISSVASDIPKPMIKIEGKPVLEHELECLRDQGFTDIIITVSHLGNIIMDYFGDRNKALALNSVASLLQQIVALVCGLIVPRLILSTFGSAANGTVASISQFISITSLIQGGVTGATRVAFYGPVATGDMKKASVVYKTSQSFYTKFALALTGYVAVLAVVYPKFVDTPFGYIDALLLVLVLGMNAIFESMFGIPSQLLMFADQKAYFNTFLQIFCTIGNAFVSVILIKLGCSLLVVKFVAALIFILRPIILNVYVRSHYAIDTSVEKDKSVLSQSNAALAKSIAFYVHSSTDNLVITACLNVMWVSVYSVHRYVVSSISNLVAAILGNTEALFGQMIARDEQDAIKHDVPMYDLMSKMLSTVFFFTCIILITPFVSLYTGGISDIDYYQPLFATLLCLAEYVYCTSLTYNNMIMAAGHIKQTQWISVTEAIINIVLSLILVKWIGIIGVALGTLIAFAFNTVANIVYMKKYIFDMSLGWIIKVYLANLVAGVLAMCLFGNIVNAHITGFISFFIWAAVVFAGVCLIDVVLNYFFFKNETKTVLYKIGKKLQGKNKD